MDTTAISAVSNSAAATAPRSAAELESGDFFDLLVAQLVNQDPLQPTSTNDLLQQISSLREIDLSSNLVDSLHTLTGQQRFGAASSLIGRHVSGQADPADPASTAQGVVVGVRFDPDGGVVLELANGVQMPLDAVSLVSSAKQAADALDGKLVTALTVDDDGNPRTVQGVVMGMSEAADGTVLLELDNGEEVEVSEVVSWTEPDAVSADAE